MSSVGVKVAESGVKGRQIRQPLLLSPHLWGKTSTKYVTPSLIVES
jgi:hypothetical protein